MSRTEIDYKNEELDYLDKDDMIAIELKAKALTLEECLAFLCVDIADVPEAEIKVAKKAWRRGRSVALDSAASKMFAAMSMRGGGVVAMDYLKQLSDTFSVEATPIGKSGDGFTFNVVMPEDS